MSRRAGAQTVLLVLGELLLTAAVLVALLLVWLLWWTGRAAESAAGEEISSLQRQWTAAPETARATVMTGRPPAGRSFAVLEIPRFGRHWRTPVIQGTGTDDLRRGVGHYPSTALPGAIGNLGIAGHRTTWGAPFSRIAQLRRGDPVVLETASGWFVYRVTGHQIVRRDGGRSSRRSRTGRGQPATTAVLTLTSCHPKYSANRRYVVHAELSSSRARVAGPPPIGGL